MADYDDHLMPPIDDMLTADADSEFIREQKKIYARLQRQNEAKEKAKKENRNKRSSKNSKDSSSESGPSNKFFKSKTKQESPSPVRSSRIETKASAAETKASRTESSRPETTETHRKSLERKSSTEDAIECVFSDSDSSHLNSTLDRSKTLAKNDSSTRSSLAADLSANSSASIKVQLDGSAESNESPTKSSEPEKSGEPEKRSQNSTKSARLDQSKQTDHSMDVKQSNEMKSQAKSQTNGGTTNGSQAKNEVNSNQTKCQANGSQIKSVETEKAIANEAKKDRKTSDRSEEVTADKMTRKDAADRVEETQKETLKGTKLKENLKSNSKEKQPVKESMDQQEQLTKVRPKREIRSTEPPAEEFQLIKRRRTCTLKDDPLQFVKPVNTPTLGVRVGLSRRISVKSSLHPELLKDLNRT